MKFFRNSLRPALEASRSNVRAIAAATAFLILAPVWVTTSPSAANVANSAILEELASWQRKLEDVRLQRMQIQAARQQLTVRFGSLMAILSGLDPRSSQAQQLLVQISQIQALDAALERQLNNANSQEIIILKEIDRLRRIIGRR